MKQIDLNDFENYVKKFDAIVNLANKFQASPNEMINFFLKVGETVLEKSKDLVIEQMETKFKGYLKENSEIDLNAAFDDLITFLKNRNTNDRKKT